MTSYGANITEPIVDYWNKYFCRLLPPKESLLNSDVTESSLYGNEPKKLREYAEDNLKLKQFRRDNFNEQKNGTAPFDHPKRVYDEFIKEDYIVTSKDKEKKE